MTLLDSVKWLIAKQKANDGRTVNYKRGGSTVATPLVLTGQTLLKLSDEYGGNRLIWTDRDYIIEASDLPSLPLIGDVVEDTINGHVYTYEANQYGSEPCYRPHDQFGVAVRIHTKLIKVV